MPSSDDHSADAFIPGPACQHMYDCEVTGVLSAGGVW